MLEPGTVVKGMLETAQSLASARQWLSVGFGTCPWAVPSVDYWVAQLRRRLQPEQHEQSASVCKQETRRRGDVKGALASTLLGVLTERASTVAPRGRQR